MHVVKMIELKDTLQKPKEYGVEATAHRVKNFVGRCLLLEGKS
jgi:hypothetical protein